MSMTRARAKESKVPAASDNGKNRAELTQIAEEAVRSQPGCETASVPAVRGLPNIREGGTGKFPTSFSATA